MAYGTVNRVLKADDGTTLFDGSGNVAADDYSETLNLNSFRRVGLWSDCGVSSGTSPTLDVSLEISADAGTTWAQFPGAINTIGTTDATMIQITESNDDAAQMKYWELANGPNVRYRVFLDIGGSATPTITSFELRLLLWDRVDGSV